MTEITMILIASLVIALLTGGIEITRTRTHKPKKPRRRVSRPYISGRRSR